MFKTIVVALQGSQGADDEVVQAVHQLKLSDQSKVVLSHVMLPIGESPDQEADLPVYTNGSYEEIESRLQTYQTRFGQALQVVTEIAVGDPSDEIVRLANLHQADLIVMGSRGLRGINRILQGSVSSQVIEAAPCSVLTVKIQG